ncbi:putative bifunctional diguanylate cyclase/phosphodiesterase [Teredinibacter waterburyi]|uniref:putative bifunctional diguanylate cyclase/phosphodiesterase n=1 Tax=Teredinibacter waterburyi TaxID=1500538 RepID=UPI00165EE4D2|nr:bifunctional diguanylate cyclase/phosphodiesterase [Teredinibacter waterburyi]
MKNTLQLISIQHELGMAIGLNLLLRPMLKHFSRVCMRRLGLAEIHAYFYSSERQTVNLSVQADDELLTSFLNLPVTEFGLDQSIINDTFSKLRAANSSYSVHQRTPSANTDSEYVYFFNLGDFGLLSLHRMQQPLDQTILNLLVPIVQRLTVSCQASIEHEQLLQAIAARDKAEQQIRFQLNHDELTQLPNRRLLLKHLQTAIDHAAATEKMGAVLFVDLDRFKSVNDTLGHAVGDALLCAVANALVSVVGRKHFVGRLSGDEFVVILTPERCSDADAKVCLRKILQQVQQVFILPIKANEHLLQITPSIGVEFYPQVAMDADAVLRNADAAMYIAKSRGPNQFVIYDRSMSEELERRLEIEKQLQVDVKRCDQFYLVYQPQYTDAGTCVGAEVLVRWYHADCSPAVFILVAEETGLILELGFWILTEACNHLREMEVRGIIDNDFEKLSVNVSAVQFNQPRFVEEVIGIINATGVSANLLGIELTESALIKNTEDMVTKIARLSALGIHISIDDFGTGYSSLAYLSRFPVDSLKIDQVFVRDLHSDAGNRAVVETIIALGQSLGISIVAEGVETEEEKRALVQAGCMLFQGYLFSRPLAHQDFVTLLENGSGAVSAIPNLSGSR